MTFIDITKTFDLISRDELFQILSKIGCSPKLLSISKCDSRLDVVKDFTYLGSTMSDGLSLDKELNRRIDRACTTLARVTKRVWQNNKLLIIINTRIAVYRACV